MKVKTKRGTKQAISFALALLMTLSLMPSMSVKAAPETYTMVLKEDGTILNGTTSTPITPSPNGLSFNPEKNEWTMNNFKFSSTSPTAVKIELKAGAETVLNLVGDNEIISTCSTGGGTTSIGLEFYCVQEDEHIIIKGSGKLTAVGGNTDGTGWTYGIYDHTNGGSRLTIEGGAINATGGNSDVSYGIEFRKNMTVTGGTLNAVGGSSNLDESTSHGISVINDGLLTIKGGTVKAAGGNSANSFGVQVGNFVVEGGSINATGGNALQASIGVAAEENINIKGGKINATGGNSTGYSYGTVVMGGDINISGGEVTSAGYIGCVFAPDPSSEITIGDGLVVKGGPSLDGSGATTINKPSDVPWIAFLSDLRYVNIKNSRPDADDPNSTNSVDPINNTLAEQPFVTSPKTGDSSKAYALITLLVASVGIITFVRKRRDA